MGSRVAGKVKQPSSAPSGPVEADWVAAARDMLIEGGVASVQINAVAQRLKVTRGGFYWRFRNRQDLLDRLLDLWENTNTRNFLIAIERSGTPKERYRRLVRLFIDEKAFNPALDGAVRQWGRVDEAVRTRVATNDELRIDALRRLFLEAGQHEDEAMIRARIVYFHQVGYYALGLHESRARRLTLVPLYDRILTGLD